MCDISINIASLFTSHLERQGQNWISENHHGVALCFSKGSLVKVIFSVMKKINKWTNKNFTDPREFYHVNKVQELRIRREFVPRKKEFIFTCLNPPVFQNSMLCMYCSKNCNKEILGSTINYSTWLKPSTWLNFG